MASLARRARMLPMCMPSRLHRALHQPAMRVAPAACLWRVVPTHPCATLALSDRSTCRPRTSSTPRSTTTTTSSTGKAHLCAHWKPPFASLRTVRTRADRWRSNMRVAGTSFSQSTSRRTRPSDSCPRASGAALACSRAAAGCTTPSTGEPTAARVRRGALFCHEPYDAPCDAPCTIRSRSTVLQASHGWRVRRADPFSIVCAVAARSRTSCSSAARRGPTRRLAWSTASASTRLPVRSSRELTDALPSRRSCAAQHVDSACGSTTGRSGERLGA